jgi:hypothetical protein
VTQPRGDDVGPVARSKARVSRRAFIAAAGAATILAATPAGDLLRDTPDGGLLKGRLAPFGLASAQAPSNTAVPAVWGAAIPGQTLCATNGTWINSPTSYAYEWHRRRTSQPPAFTVIPGATGSTYDLRPDDDGARIAVRVIAANVYGRTSATSGYTPTVSLRPLINEAPPKISTVTPEVGEVISVTNGRWA